MNWHRLLCFLLALVTLGLRGHRWRLLRVNVFKAVALVHLDSMAGLDAECTRCKLKWEDAEPDHYPWQPIVDVERELYVNPWDGPTHETASITKH